MTDSDGKIDNQEEFDRETLWWNTEVKKMTRFRMIRQPMLSLRTILENINRAEAIGLFSHEECEAKRKRITDDVAFASQQTSVKELLKKLWRNRPHG